MIQIEKDREEDKERTRDRETRRERELEKERTRPHQHHLNMFASSLALGFQGPYLFRMSGVVTENYGNARGMPNINFVFDAG